MPRRDTTEVRGGGTYESVETLVDGVLGLEADGPLVVVRNDPAAIAEIRDRGRRFVVPHDGHLVDLFDDILGGGEEVKRERVKRTTNDGNKK